MCYAFRETVVDFVKLLRAFQLSWRRLHLFTISCECLIFFGMLEILNILFYAAGDISRVCLGNLKDVAGIFFTLLALSLNSFISIALAITIIYLDSKIRGPFTS